MENKTETDHGPFHVYVNDVLAQILTKDIMGNRVQVTVNTKGQVHVYLDRREIFEYAGLVADEEGEEDEEM